MNRQSFADDTVICRNLFGARIASGTAENRIFRTAKYEVNHIETIGSVQTEKKKDGELNDTISNRS